MAAHASRSLASAPCDTPEPMRSRPSRAAPTSGGLCSGARRAPRRHRLHGVRQPGQERVVVVLEDPAGEHHVELAARQPDAADHGDGHGGQLIGQAVEQATGHGVAIRGPR